jgi:hypothetical protein
MKITRSNKTCFMSKNREHILIFIANDKYIIRHITVYDYNPSKLSPYLFDVTTRCVTKLREIYVKDYKRTTTYEDDEA